MAVSNTLLRRRVIPGFGISLGVTLFGLGLIVLAPLAALVVKAIGLGPSDFFSLATAPRVIKALQVSFTTSFIAALFDAVAGLIIAVALVRYKFPGRGLVDAIIDLPFALPTAVAGIALASAYGPNGWIGGPLAALGIKTAFNPTGIVIALAFIGLPFVVRTVQPVLSEIERDTEEAAALLGATPLQTFRRIILPAIIPALITGFALAFARGIGEYGSVIFIAGNIPMVSEIAPLLIVIKLEEFDYSGAAAIGVLMLFFSFLLLFLINGIERLTRKVFGHD
jgi:sulfate transport system permease protein